MNITATLDEDQLKIQVPEKNVNFQTGYDDDKTYVGNILTFFPGMGITEFKIEDDKDCLTLEKLCKEPK